MKFLKGRFAPLEKINLLQRWIIIHSIIYYIYNSNIVDDVIYDNNMKQLLEFKNKLPKTYKKSNYYYCFNDFDGNTGYDIPKRLNKHDKQKFKYEIKKLKEWGYWK